MCFGHAYGQCVPEVFQKKVGTYDETGVKSNLAFKLLSNFTCIATLNWQEVASFDVSVPTKQQ